MRTAFFLIAALLTSWVGSQPARATLIQALDLSELVAEADHVVVARVMQQRSLFDEQGRIVTDVQLQVESIEKGSLAPGASMTLRRLGGEVDGLGMRVEGEPAFDDGERILLFGTANKHAVVRPIGMSQGTLRVYDDKGEPWVKAANSGLTLVRKHADGTSSQTHTSAQPRRLSDLLSEIRGLVAKAKRP